VRATVPVQEGKDGEIAVLLVMRAHGCHSPGLKELGVQPKMLQVSHAVSSDSTYLDKEMLLEEASRLTPCRSDG
jgi:hypothetical protein